MMVEKSPISHQSVANQLTLSRHSILQGESDSSEGLIHTITNKLGSIFTSDSSDADVSGTDDNDKSFTLYYRVFESSQQPTGRVRLGK